VESWAGQTEPGRRDLIVVHEAMHVLVNEMRASLPAGYYWSADDMRHEERVCTTLAMLLVGAYQQGEEKS
jgi:hypothetical protein